MTTAEFLDTARSTIGANLSGFESGGYSDVHGMSTSKVSDLKPMLGEIFARILAPYDFWGFIQEDVLLGRLNSCISPLLESFDVLSPFGGQLNASGVFMLFRNVDRINRLWRQSRDASRVLSDPAYLVWDEWWGELSDNFPALVGREAEAGRLRLHLGDERIIRPGEAALRWFGDDLHIVGRRPLLLCWLKNGAVVFNRGVDYEGMPCLGSAHAHRLPGSASGPRRFVQPEASEECCLFHFVRLKHRPELKQLNLTPTSGSTEAASLLHRREYFALTPEGAWLGPGLDGASPLLLSAAIRTPPTPQAEGVPRATFTVPSFRAYLRSGLDRMSLVPTTRAVKLLPHMSA